MIDQGEIQNPPYIRLYIGTGSYYVLVDRIKLVTAEPKIVRVPESQEGILGISMYKGEMIPYLDLAMNAAQDVNAEGKQLGVIVETGDRDLIGVMADGVSEQVRLTDENLGAQLEDECREILGRRDV